MYGKIFESLFTGSMRGTGPLNISVWSYVIAHMKPDEVHGAVVELDCEVLAFFIGKCTAVEVSEVIDSYCEPDPKSRTPDEQGKKLVKLGQFSYRVVNGSKYRAIKDQEERRRQNREAQQRFRSKEKDLKKQAREKSESDKIVSQALEEGTPF
jgi:hypothetical protein